MTALGKREYVSIFGTDYRRQTELVFGIIFTSQTWQMLIYWV